MSLYYNNILSIICPTFTKKNMNQFFFLKKTYFIKGKNYRFKPSLNFGNHSHRFKPTFKPRTMYGPMRRRPGGIGGCTKPTSGQEMTIYRIPISIFQFPHHATKHLLRLFSHNLYLCATIVIFIIV